MTNRQKFLKALYDLKALDLASAVNLTVISQQSGVGKNAWADSTYLSTENLIDCHFKTDPYTLRNMKVCWLTQQGIDALKNIKVSIEDVVTDLLAVEEPTLTQQDSVPERSTSYSDLLPVHSNVDTIAEPHELLNIQRMLVNSSVEGINLADPLDVQVGTLLTKHLELLAKFHKESPPNFSPPMPNFDTYLATQDGVEMYKCNNFEEAVTTATKFSTENNRTLQVIGITLLALIEPLVTITPKVTLLGSTQPTSNEG